MSQLDPARRQLLLQVVQDGAGQRNARTIDIQMSIRMPSGDLTVLDELKILETEGKVRRVLDKQGETKGWCITETGSVELENLLTDE